MSDYEYDEDFEKEDKQNSNKKQEVNNDFDEIDLGDSPDKKIEPKQEISQKNDNFSTNISKNNNDNNDIQKSQTGKNEGIIQNNESGIETLSFATKPRRTLNQRKNIANPFGNKSKVFEPVNQEDKDKEEALKTSKIISSKEPYKKEIERNFAFDILYHDDIKVRNERTIEVQQFARSYEPKIALVEPELEFNKNYELIFKINRLIDRKAFMAIGILTHKYIHSKNKYEYTNSKSGIYMITHDKNQIQGNDKVVTQSIGFEEGDEIKIELKTSGQIIFTNLKTKQKSELIMQLKSKDSKDPLYAAAIMKNDGDSVTFVSGKILDNENPLAQSKVYQQIVDDQLISECFINLKKFIRKNRVQLLKNFDELSNKKVFVINPKKSLPENELNELKKLRQFLWSSFVTKDEFYQVLKDFEFNKYSDETIYKTVERLHCLNEKQQLINYRRLFAGYQKKNEISNLTHQFQTFRPLKLIYKTEPEAEQKILTEISALYKLKKENKKKREEKLSQKIKNYAMPELPGQKKDQEQLEIEKKNQETLEQMKQGSQNVLETLRERVKKSDISLDEIFKKLDKNGDGFISQAEFVRAFQKGGFDVDEHILINAFKKFDVNNDDRVSYIEFIDTLLGDENNKHAVGFLKEAEQILDRIRKYMKGQFDTLRDFEKEVSNYFPGQQRIFYRDFKMFVDRFTQRNFSEGQIKSVFKYIGQENESQVEVTYIEKEQINELIQHNLKKQDINKQKLEEQIQQKRQESYEEEFKRKQEEKQLQQQKQEAKKVYDISQKENTSDYKSVQDKKLVQIFAGKENKDEDYSIKKAREARMRTKIFKEDVEYLEQVLQNMAKNILKKINSSKKTLRELFDLYSENQFGYLNIEEFMYLINYVEEDKESRKKYHDDVLKSVFHLFSNEITQRMSFNLFQHLVNTANNINPFYLKFKRKFGPGFEQKKQFLEEDFQRLDIFKGDGFVKVSDLKEIMSTNDIPVEQSDIQYLQDNGYLRNQQGQSEVNYKKLISAIFPQNIQIQQEIFQKHIQIIMRFFKLFKERRKQKKENQENQQQLQSIKKGTQQDLKKSKKKVTIQAPSEKTKGKQPFSKTQTQLQSKDSSELKTISQTMKGEEIFDFMDQQQQKEGKNEVQDNLQKQLISARSGRNSQVRKPLARGKNKVVKKDLDSQIEALGLGGQKGDNFEKEKRTVVKGFCGEILDSILDKVYSFGQSVTLSKQIQKKFENRPVNKEVYVALQDFEIDVQDVFPKSLYVSEQTGRVMYIDHQCYLHQYDFANRQKLKKIYIGSKVPLKRTKILDSVFDTFSNRLFVLNDKWILEIWDIAQGQSIPIQRIRLFSENQPTQSQIEACYKRRFQGLVPNFLILSEALHNSVIVNCTCVNNSLVFIDSISLSIFNTLHFSPQDYKMGYNLSKLVQIMLPKFHELRRKNIGFNELFQGKFRQTEEESQVVSTAVFTDMLKEVFGDQNGHAEIPLEEWNEVTEFLDQNNSGQIDEQEYDFLSEMHKFVQKNDQKLEQNFNKLSGISYNAMEILKKLEEYLKQMKLTVEEAFAVFDSDNSGQIGVNEFEKILDRVGGASYITRENKRELIDFIDQDKSNTIDIKEFSEIFGVATDPCQKNYQTDIRKNMMLCFSKSYQGGIDVEKLLLDADPGREGNISTICFRNILKWLPLGLLEEEIDFIMNNQVSYTDTGNVNYLQFINKLQFKEMKFQFRLRKQMVQGEELENFSENINESKKNDLLQSQKVIIESIIFIDEFDLIIYTTLCPKTSLIFVSQSKKNRDPNKISFLREQEIKGNTNKKSIDSEIFENKLLAKLQGHHTTNAPSIYYCKESGFLISGEKLDPKKGYNPKQSSNGQNQGQKNNFSSYYDNIEMGAGAQTANIIIWDLQNSIQKLYESNPPWKISPVKIINAAHNDSIIDINYLPFSQLIVTTSMDKTVKLWDPTAKPYSLNAPGAQSTKQIKPGYYVQTQKNEQTTISNLPFALIRTIYTGSKVCYSLQNLFKKIPVDVSGQQGGGEYSAPRKFQALELLFTVNLDQAQVIEGKHRTVGQLRGFSIDKMQIQIPGKLHDEIIPKKYQDELERLAIERKKKAYINYQLSLPIALESLKSNNKVQNSEMDRAVSLLRSLNLYKYDQSEKYDMEKDIENLFTLFLQLPFRKSFKNSLGGAASKKKLTANEIFYYLKRFHNIHPFSMTRENFLQQVLEIKRNKLQGDQIFNEMEKKLAKNFKIDSLQIHDELNECASAKLIPATGIVPEDIQVTRYDFKQKLQQLEVWTNEQEFVELLSKLDPLYTNWISANAVEELFSASIIQNKLFYLSKPKELINKIMGGLDNKQRTNLMYQLSIIDSSCDGYLSLEEFKKAFTLAQIDVDRRLLEEIFQVFGEKFNEQDLFKVISFQKISKELFNSSENLLLAKYMHILGKIKRALIEKGLQMDYPFKDINQKTQREAGPPFQQISQKNFIEKIQELRLPNVNLSEIQQVTEFMAVTSDEQTDTAVVSMAKFLHYLKKIHTKDTYLIANDFQKLYNEVRSILNRSEEFKKIYKYYFGKKHLQQQDLRLILQKMEVNSDNVDDLMLKFCVDKKEIVANEFLEQLKEFQIEFDGLAPKKMIIDEEEEGQESDDKKKAKQLIGEEEKEEENILQNIILHKKKNEDNELNKKELFIRDYKHTEILVNYIRQNDPIQIPKMLRQTKDQDAECEGEIEISLFCTILQNNISGLSEQMLINFQKEYTFYNQGSRIDYQEFFEKYLLDEKQKNQLKKEELERTLSGQSKQFQKKEGTAQSENTTFSQQYDQNLENINPILEKITCKKIKILPKIVKFFSEEAFDNTINPEEFFNHLQNTFKVNLTVGDMNKIKQVYRSEFHKDRIHSQKLLDALNVCSKNVQATFDENTWMIYAKDVGKEVLEIARTNSGFLQFSIAQEIKRQNSQLILPLSTAAVFQNSMQNVRDFKAKDCERLVTYAIVGSSVSREEGFKKIMQLENDHDLENYLVNVDLFFAGLGKVIANLEELERKEVLDNKNKQQTLAQREIEKTQKQLLQVSEEQQYLMSQITGKLKDRGTSLWDALLSTDITINEEQQVPLREFKFILNSLNLNLTLKEKLLLINLADPLNTRKCDIQLFMKKFDQQNSLSKKGISSILEKFATALFYNDISISKAFEAFDIDHDGAISKNEFIYGMQQLDLGLSLFEINQIMEMLDLDKSGSIEQHEFEAAIKKHNSECDIDPLKDYSLSLLTKIKNLIQIKGGDLMQSLQEIDTVGKGYLTYEEVKQGLKIFGLPNLKNYQALTLYKIYKKKKIVQQGKDKDDLGKKKSILKNSDALSKSRFGPSSANASFMSTPRLPNKQSSQQQSWVATEDFEGKEEITQEEIQQDKINIKEYVRKVLEAVNVYAKSAIDNNNELLRKVAKLLKNKNISLFEAFLFMDVNQTGFISKLELNVGLKNLDIPLNELDFQIFWKIFDKNKANRISFTNFFKKFKQSGAINLITFDDTLSNLIKKFSQVITKFGDYSQAFAKFDKNNNGAVSNLELRDANKKFSLAFKQQEVDLLFKALITADSIYASKKFELKTPEQIDDGKQTQNAEGQNQQQTQVFYYRQFVRLLNQFSSKNLEDKALYKLSIASNEQNLNWKEEILNHNKKFDPKTKDMNSIFIRNFKDLLIKGKFNLTGEEIDHILNSFDSIYISAASIQKKMKIAASKLDESEKQKQFMMHGLVLRIQEAMQKLQIGLERLFQQFDENQNGTMNLKELTLMIQFLNININKNQTKVLFQALDVDRKNYFTINEFRNFLDESLFVRQGGNKQNENSGNQRQQERIEISQLFEITSKIKQALLQSKKSLSEFIYEIGLNEQSAVNAKNMEQLLFAMGVTLKKDEIAFLIQKINSNQEFVSSGGNIFLTYQQFLDFAIRENIEQIAYEENVNYIHPTMAICIEKMSNMFRRLEIDSKLVFKYIKKSDKKVITRKEFLKMLQCFDLNFSGDDLQLLQKYFDEKHHGEITEETFVEKFEYLANLGLNKVREQNQDEIEQQQDEEYDNKLKIMRMSSKVQVQSIMQKIFFFMQDKKYNKKQMKAIFDKNGNGILSRQEFMDALNDLQIGIPIMKARIVMDYLDKRETGEVLVEDVIKNIFTSIPAAYRKMYDHDGIVKIFSGIVSKLKKETDVLLEEIINQEKQVRPEGYTTNLYKVKSGIQTQEFFKILRRLQIKVSENDKEQIKQMFTLKMNREFLDLEHVYDIIDSIYFDKIKNSLTSEAFIDSESLSTIWEQKIYRKIGNYLKKHNMNVEQAFKHIDQDNSGLINMEEFKRFIISCEMDLSQKEINQLVSSFMTTDGLINMESFKQKFWEAYTCYGRDHGSSQIQKQEIEQLIDEQKRVLIYIFMALREKCANSLEKAWSLLDIRKVGYFQIQDYKKALVNLGIYVSKSELSFSFNFIDKQKNNLVNFFEFADFWQAGQENLLIIDKRFDEYKNVNELVKNEQQILEHIAKLINQREISLASAFQEIDPEAKGYFDEYQFQIFLDKLGVDLREEEGQIQQLMKLIDPKSNGEIVHLSALEARLNKFNLQIIQKSEVEIVEWRDLTLTKMAIAIQENIGNDKTIAEYFKEFDSDFDGYLTVRETFEALKYVGINQRVQDYQIQRIIHKLISKEQKQNEIPRVSIESLDNYFGKLMIDIETQMQNYICKEDMYQPYILVQQDQFQNLIKKYDIFQTLFDQISKMRKSGLDLSQKLHEIGKQLRGLKLISKQLNFEQISGLFEGLIERLQFLVQAVQKQSKNYISQQVSVKHISPLQNVFQTDSETLRIANLELERAQPNFLQEVSEFHIEADSLAYLTPFVKRFQGEVVRSGRVVQIFVYGKETLQFVSQDGNVFEEHLMDELRLHNCLSRKGGAIPYMFNNIGYFEKRIGIDSGDKEIYVVNEYVDPQEYQSFSELIYNNGGILRVPFLTKTNAVTYLAKFWGRQILDIINETHQLGAVLNILRPENLFISLDGQYIKLNSVRGSARLNRFARIDQAPDLKINLIDVNGPRYVSEGQTFEGVKMSEYLEKLKQQPYLAPEQVGKPTQELTPYVDVWAFGCLMYEILFGQPPQSYYKIMSDFQNKKVEDMEPSDYFHYDLFSDELVQDILKKDYNIVLDQQEYNPSSMEKAIGKQTFGGIFQEIFAGKQSEENKDDQLGFTELGEILDIIACCLEFHPTKRPTIRGLLASNLFKQNEHQIVNALEFSNSMFFYKSPQVGIGERVFQPLRQLCAYSIEDSLDFGDQNVHNNLLYIMDLVRNSVLNKTSQALEKLKKNVTMNEQSQTFQLKTGMPLAMMDKLQSQEKARKKLSNNVLVKYVFDNDILEMLVFLALRHHSYMNKRENKLVKNVDINKAKNNIHKFNSIRDQSMQMLQAIKEVFKALIYQLDDYGSAVAPYVSKVVENLVKMFLGEEYKLGSDIIDILNINSGFVPEKNTYQEYNQEQERQEQENNMCRQFYNKFFNRNVDQQTQDEADKKWKEINPISQKPYIFQSRNWTPVLYTILGPLFKDTISEAGVGKGSYPVIQDYIRFCSEKQKVQEHDLGKKVQQLNQQINRQIPRTADYYNDLIMMAENLSMVYDYQNISNSSIRIVLSYFKAMLLSNNTDKIKLLLDSKALVYLIPLLNSDDPHVRQELLEIFLEISTGFQALKYSYIKKQIKKTDEINKNLGIVAHINQVSEDKIDRERFLDCANDYYYLKKQINQVFMYQTAFVFETPNLLQNLFYTLKSNAELIQNKILMVKIFANLLEAPKSVIRLLQSGTVDIFPSVFRFLIKPKPGMAQQEMKMNKIMGPVVADVYKKIQVESRKEVIEILKNTPKIRVMLKEYGFEIPLELNLLLLGNKVEILHDSYQNEKQTIQMEIKGNILSQNGHKNQSLAQQNTSFYQFYLYLKETLSHTLSWFKNYSNDKYCNLEGAIDICQSIISLGKSIIEDLYPYAQVHEGAEMIITEIADFIEILINMNKIKMVFNLDTPQQAIKNIQWLQETINKIYKYHEKMGKQNTQKLQEKDHLRQTEIQNLRASIYSLKKGLEKSKDFTRTQTLLQSQNKELEEKQFEYVLDHENIRLYSQNKLNKIAHSFLRILLTLTEIQDEKMYSVLNQAEFGKFYFHLVHKQYQLIETIIKFKTERIHILQNYVEEANFRVKAFENILEGKNNELKDFLVQQGFLGKVFGTYLTNEKEFDLGQARTGMDFLPFREFIPLRNEALAMLTAIFWHKDESQGIYKESLLQISHYNLIKREYENLNKNEQSSQVFLSSLYFFALLANSNDKQLIFLMKHERVNTFLDNFFQNNPSYIKYYPSLYQMSINGGQFKIK